jgi:hypothetical protein
MRAHSLSLFSTNKQQKTEEITPIKGILTLTLSLSFFDTTGAIATLVLMMSICLISPLAPASPERSAMLSTQEVNDTYTSTNFIINRPNDGSFDIVECLKFLVPLLPPAVEKASLRSYMLDHLLIKTTKRSDVLNSWRV